MDDRPQAPETEEERRLRLLCERGYRFELGEGVEKDVRAALRCYREAAEAGYAEAQHHLAECYEYGVGTEENADAAWFWYNMAAEQGHEEAMEAVEAHRPVEPEEEPELPADGRANLQRLREAHQFGNAIALRGAPAAAFIAALWEGLHYSSLESAFHAGVGGLFLGYLVMYACGTLVRYIH